MKKTTLFILGFLFLVSLGWGDVTENFDSWSDGSYGTISTYNHTGVGQWETYNSMCQATNARSGNCVRFNDDSGENEYLLFSGLDGNGKDGGVGTISFWYRHWDGDASNVQFQVQYKIGFGSWVNVGSVVDVPNDTSYREFSEDVNITDDNVFVQVISIDDAERLCIDDFSITDYSGGPIPPSISNIIQDPATDITSSTTVSVSADVTDADGISSVELHWGTTSGSLGTTISMSNGGSGDNYTTSSDIPAQSDGTTVYYEVYAEDDNTNPTTSGEFSYYVSDAVAPGVGDLYITEVDSRYARGCFVEIFNYSSNSLLLNNISLEHYNGSSPANVTIDFSGILAPGGYYLIARNQGNLVSTYGIEADIYDNNMYLNDGDEWLVLIDDTRQVLDNFVASGVTWSEDHTFERTNISEDGTSISDWTDIGDVVGTPGAENDNPLPVNLSAFYALYIGGIPTLYWTTQSETENVYWNVYRGTNNNLTEAVHLNANDPVPGNGTTNTASDYVYVDNAPVVQNSTYWYWIEDVSFDGETVVHEPITLEIPFEDTPITPDTYGLHQNYPNPFNPSTSISFALAEDSDVELIIYNVKGAKIRTIFTDHVYANDITSVVWDGNDADGKQVSSGVYFYKLITDTKEYQRKMLLVK